MKTTLITVKAGERFIVTLPSNPTTGYCWHLSSPLPGDLLLLLGSEYLPDQTRRRGSGGKENWSFRGLKNGETRIVFQYARSWEKSKPPLREQVFLIICR